MRRISFFICPRKYQPMWGWKNPDHTTEVQFREAGLDLSNPKIRSFLDLTMALQDLPRHLGQHSGGMVVCQGQLDRVVPLEPASMPKRVVCNGTRKTAPIWASSKSTSWVWG